MCRARGPQAGKPDRAMTLAEMEAFVPQLSCSTDKMSKHGTLCPTGRRHYN